MEGFELLYRGSLKSCNYQCSYCPFSKHRRSERELEKDREQWMEMIQRLEAQKDVYPVGTVLVVPYGEALIHPWYWEGLARLSRLQGIRGVGAQTNGSFWPEESLALFEQAKGDLKKLRLWITFHPEMISAEAFAKTCGQLQKAGVRLCVGAVGVPGNLSVLQRLRRELPGELYLWINRMDGLKRAYTDEEAEAFQEIDPYFPRELAIVPADPDQCQNRLFLEGDGRMRICNISRNQKERQCSSKWCSCYLAYGGRQHFMNQILFGPDPIFRIPRRAKAVFLDIMGTLIPEEGQGTVSGWVRAGLEGLKADKIPLFFATTLPAREAKRRCPEIWHLFSGGVFAGGGHVILEEAGTIREIWHPMDRGILTAAQKLRENMGGELHIYRTRSGIYKITLVRERKRQWEAAEEAEVRALLLNQGKGIRVFAERNCLQIVSEHASKAEGVCQICRWLGIQPKEAVGAGDGPEDQKMLELFQEAR